MKQLIQFSLISGLLMSHSALALNPIQGFYGGALASISHGPSSYPLSFELKNENFSGTVNNSTLGGSGGAVLGYRMQKFRLEGEALFNYTPTGTLTLGACTLESPSVISPTGNCSKVLQENNVGFNGSTSTAYAMINAYFDFISYDSENNVVPYVGFGIGGSRLKKSVNFENSVTKDSINGASVTANSTAAQFILGVSFFLDDYAWAGMDYRYLTTNTIQNSDINILGNTFNFQNSRYALNTLNFNINFSFDNSAN